jgi:hypothetical protein
MHQVCHAVDLARAFCLAFYRIRSEGVSPRLRETLALALGDEFRSTKDSGLSALGSSSLFVGNFIGIDTFSVCAGANTYGNSDRNSY